MHITLWGSPALHIYFKDSTHWVDTESYWTRVKILKGWS